MFLLMPDRPFCPLLLQGDDGAVADAADGRGDRHHGSTFLKGRSAPLMTLGPRRDRGQRTPRVHDRTAPAVHAEQGHVIGGGSLRVAVPDRDLDESGASPLPDNWGPGVIKTIDLGIFRVLELLQGCSRTSTGSIPRPMSPTGLMSRSSMRCCRAS